MKLTRTTKLANWIPKIEAKKTQKSATIILIEEQYSTRALSVKSLEYPIDKQHKARTQYQKNISTTKRTSKIFKQEAPKVTNIK